MPRRRLTTPRACADVELIPGRPGVAALLCDGLRTYVPHRGSEYVHQTRWWMEWGDEGMLAEACAAETKCRLATDKFLPEGLPDQIVPSLLARSNHRAWRLRGPSAELGINGRPTTNVRSVPWKVVFTARGILTEG